MVNINQSEDKNEELKLSPLGTDEINSVIKSFKNSTFNQEEFYKKDEKNFVKKTLFDLAKELSGRFEQDAFIFGEVGKRTGKRYIDAFDSQGNRVKYGGPWSGLEPIEKDADFWSRVRGSTFVFKEQEQVAESLDMPAGRDTSAMAKDLEGSTIRAVYTQMMDQTNDKKGFQKTRLHKDLRNLTGTAEAYDRQKIEQFIKDQTNAYPTHDL